MKATTFATLALVSLLAGLTYVNLLWMPLIFDDPGALRTARVTGENSLLQFLFIRRGLTFLSIYADSVVWGSWEVGFRISNLALHCLASSLVVLLASTISRDRFLGLVTGLLFAVHPVHVEAVASVENRKDILAMIIVCASALLYYRRKHSIGKLVASLLLLAVGIGLVKDIAVVGLVIMLPAGDLLLRNAHPEHAGQENRPPRIGLMIIFGTALLLLITKYAHLFSRESIMRETGLQLSSYSQVLLNSMASVPDQLRLLFFPYKLSFDYPFSNQAHQLLPGAVFGCLLLAAWIGLIVWAARKMALVSFAATWMLVMAAPSWNLVPLSHFFVAERYLYVPSFGACLFIALALKGLRDRASRRWSRNVCLSLLILLLLAGAVRIVLRNRDWSSDYALADSALRAGFSSWRIHQLVGVGLGQQGRFDEAERELQKAINDQPGQLHPHFDLAKLYLKWGRLEDAVSSLERLLAMYPPYTEVEIILANVLRELERPDEALKHYENLLAADARNWVAAFGKAKTLEQCGREALAMDAYRDLLGLESVDSRRRVESLISLAVLSARRAETDEELREALLITVEACGITNFTEPVPIYFQATVHERLGNGKKALAMAQIAMPQARKQGRKALVQRILELIQRLNAPSSSKSR